FQGISQMNASGSERRNGSEEDGCSNRQSEGEAKQAKIEADVQGRSFKAIGDHAEKQPVGDRSETDAEYPADEGENQALGEELPDDACASCSERLANGELASARGGAGQKEIGDVGAGNEQDQRDDGHEDLQRLRELTPQRGEAIGHRGERDMRSS